jgi:hypothetical protein
MNNFVIKAISPELSFEIEAMIKKIQESFGINLTKMQSSKLVAWKSKSSKLELTSERLMNILGGKI